MTDKDFRRCLEVTVKGLTQSIRNKEYLIDRIDENNKKATKEQKDKMKKTRNLYVQQIAVFEIQLSPVQEELDRINKGGE